MTLAEYLHTYLGSFAGYLGWTVEAGSYAFVVSETLFTYGVSSEAEATDLKKLRTIGKFKLWEKVLVEVSQDCNFSADGSSFSRNQVYEMAYKNFEKALQDATQYLPEFQIQVVGVDFSDPYCSKR